jgi:hypothetical protein
MIETKPTPARAGQATDDTDPLTLTQLCELLVRIFAAHKRTVDTDTDQAYYQGRCDGLRLLLALSTGDLRENAARILENGTSIQLAAITQKDKAILNDIG